MQASDVTATLERALAASGLDQVTVVHRPRLLTDNGSSYIAEDLALWLESRGMAHIRGAAPSADPGQDQAVASDAEEPHPAGELPPARRPGGTGRGLCGALQSPALPREPRQSHASRRLLRPRPDPSAGTRADQKTNHPAAALAALGPRCLTSTQMS